ASLMEETEGIEQNRSLLLTAVNDKKSAVDSAHAVLSEKLASIPEALRSLAVLEKEITQAIAAKNGMEREWNAAQEQFQKAKERLASSAVAVQHSKAAAEEMTVKRQNAETEFRQALEKSEFESEE